MAITRISLRASKLPTFKAHMDMEGWEPSANKDVTDSETIQFEKRQETISVTARKGEEFIVEGPSVTIEKIAKHMGASKEKIEFTELQLSWSKRNSSDKYAEVCTIKDGKITLSTETDDRHDGRSGSKTITISEFLSTAPNNQFYKSIKSALGNTILQHILGVSHVVHKRIVQESNIGKGDGGEPSLINQPQESLVQPKVKVISKEKHTTKISSRVKTKTREIKPFLLILGIAITVYGLYRLVNLIVFMVEYEFFVPSALIAPVLMSFGPSYLYYRLNKRAKQSNN